MLGAITSQVVAVLISIVTKLTSYVTEVKPSHLPCLHPFALDTESLTTLIIHLSFGTVVKEVSVG
jgi:hypothetical protein